MGDSRDLSDNVIQWHKKWTTAHVSLAEPAALSSTKVFDPILFDSPEHEAGSAVPTNPFTDLLALRNIIGLVSSPRHHERGQRDPQDAAHRATHSSDLMRASYPRTYLHQNTSHSI